jgi:DNA-binding protein HU-beta
VNKAELVEFVADKIGSSKAEAERYIEAVMEGVVEALRQPGGELKISGWGAFSRSDRKAGTGRNPQTGEAIKIAASKNLKFDAARAMKASLNAKRRGRKRA